MATLEFYIRSATETEARGPFTQEQLVSLVEVGQMDAETLYYDAATEQWAVISSNPDLKAALFPEKKKLTIKARERVQTLNVEKEGSAAITVQEMLAAAEGRTEETKGKRDPAIAQARCATIGLRTLTVLLFASAVTLLLPYFDQVIKLDPLFFLQQPLVIFGAIDLLLGVLMVLQAVVFYPVVRFRAALGLGFLGFLFWAQGLPVPMLGLAGASAGMYFCTIFVSYIPLFMTMAIGLAGTAGFAYCLLT